jgi:hypothetical protein
MELCESSTTKTITILSQARYFLSATTSNELVFLLVDSIQQQEQVTSGYLQCDKWKVDNN